MNYYDNIGELTWGSADGKQRLIKDLDLSHLVNILNWVNDPTNFYSPEFIIGLEKYASEQKFILFSSKKPYPDKVDGRWMIVNPVTGETTIEAPPKQYIKEVRKIAAAEKVPDRIKHLVDRWNVQ